VNETPGSNRYRLGVGRSARYSGSDRHIVKGYGSARNSDNRINRDCFRIGGVHDLRGGTTCRKMLAKN
jgi:hypothetical protein